MGTTEWRWLNTSTGPDVLCPSNASCQVLFLKDAKSAELQYVSLYLLFRRLTYIVYPSIISWLLVLLCCKFWKSYVCLNKDPPLKDLTPGTVACHSLEKLYRFYSLGGNFLTEDASNMAVCSKRIFSASQRSESSEPKTPERS